MRMTAMLVKRNEKVRMMKSCIVFMIMAVMCHKLNAQEPLTAEQSDPVRIGWMAGFPPPQDKVISAMDGSFFSFPALRYSVCHMRQFMPTTEVQAALTDRYKYKVKLDAGIDTITFIPLNGDQPMTRQTQPSRTHCYVMAVPGT